MNHSGWARVIALIFPYFIIVGLFQLAGAFVAGIPFGDNDFQETSLQQLIMTLMGAKILQKIPMMMMTQFLIHQTLVQKEI